jgi:hypothetical protein
VAIELSVHGALTCRFALYVLPDSVADALPDFPFAVDPDDHCESPLQAYRDIAPLLTWLARTRHKSNFENQTDDSVRAELGIYDPYYCNGAVVANLASLGFTKVYHDKQDCYAIWADPSCLPNFDVLVTNPPYSDNHVERLLQFVASAAFGSRPWFLLLPTWVHKKDYYVTATASMTPFYLVPPSNRRYVYHPPPHFRTKTKSAVHVKSSPFVSMWYCWGGTSRVNEELMQHFNSCSNNLFGGCDLARSKSALRDLRRKQR